MNILDENVPGDQRSLLQSWGIPIHQIGFDVGEKGMKDKEIIPLLHRLRDTTFFTRDLGFYDRKLCHSRYCLVCLAVSKNEVAVFRAPHLTPSRTGHKSKADGHGDSCLSRRVFDSATECSERDLHQLVSHKPMPPTTPRGVKRA